MNTEKSVSKHLLERLTDVSFTQLLRCLQIETGTRIGDEAVLEKQAVRLVPILDLNYPSCELADWQEPGAGESRPRLAVSFFGLFGPSGALPDHYTQPMIERTRNKDASLSEFLNIFNHRLLSLFYQVWEKHSFPVSFETSFAAGQESLVSQSLWAIVQSRLGSSRNRLSIDDDCILYYGGLFSSCRPSMESLRACVSDFSGITCEIEPLVGQWLELDPTDQTQIGVIALGETTGNRLGVDSIAGQRVWDIEQRFRIILGPTTWKTLDDYLPANTTVRRITDLIRRYVGPEWDFDIQVLVKPEEVRGVVFDADSEFYLGWNTWLGTWNSSEPAGHSIFELADISNSSTYSG
ncbi:MAG: type VI secretion system baseplate subunit TssG [Pirellula sp.]